MANTIIQFELRKKSKDRFIADNENVYVFGHINEYMLSELLHDNENYLALIGEKAGITKRNKPKKVTIEIWEENDGTLAWYDFKVIPEIKQIEAEVFESESLKATIYPEIKNVGDLLGIIFPLSPETTFGFLNQPMQKFEHRVSKHDGIESLVFQQQKKEEVLAFEKETWSIGKTGGTVVTNNPKGLSESTGHAGKEAFDYFGGALICESIMRNKDAKLIAAAPDLLEACYLAKIVLEGILNTESLSESHDDIGKKYRIILDALIKSGI